VFLQTLWTAPFSLHLRVRPFGLRQLALSAALIGGMLGFSIVSELKPSLELLRGRLQWPAYVLGILVLLGFGVFTDTRFIYFRF